MDRFEKFMAEVRAQGLHEKVSILAGVTPLKSDKGAKFINKFVSGISIPEEIITRLANAEDKKAEGLSQAIETIEHVKSIEGIAGVHVMAIAWESKVPEITERAGLLPRPQL
jgi:methylenetetrahydrofolate reductase (NADPH)